MTARKIRYNQTQQLVLMICSDQIQSRYENDMRKNNGQINQYESV